jgi:hypothetical protein
MPIVGSAAFSARSNSRVLSLLPSFTKMTSLGIKSFCRTTDNRRLNSRMTSSSLYAGTTIDTKLTGFDSLLVDEPFIFEALGSFIAH